MKSDRKILSKLLLIYILVKGFVITTSAQLLVVDAETPPYSPNNLIENIFLGDGVELTNVDYSGEDFSVGFFSNGITPVQMERGIVMTTGRADAAADQNQNAVVESSGSSGSSVSDPQLNAISTGTLLDQSVYEISFIPISDTLRFRYAFASEEYPNFVCDDFNDVFGFFINGPNPSGGNYNWENIALVPDPTDPSGLSFLNLPVSINTVNNGVAASSNSTVCELGNDQYFNFVMNGQTPVYNGILDPFVAQAIVVPCQEYTIKLAIGDGTDSQFNSAVFLEAKSFGTGSLVVNTETFSLDGSVAEGCSTAQIEFTLPSDVISDFPLDFQILTTGLTVPIASNGVDYTMVDQNLFIPAGSNTVSFILEAFDDGLVEGDEYFVFDIQRDVCNRDTFFIPIRDNILEAPILPNDFALCNGDDQLIDITLPPNFILPDPPSFRNGNTLNINAFQTEFRSDIVVSGVVPEFLGPNVIKEICIDTLTHLIPFDLDIYLQTPGGQILELSTDNGFRLPAGSNFMQIDTFLNTCFTLGAPVNINNATPQIGGIFPANPTYTGEFAPEGVWSDLWDGEHPANGTYSLIIVDDEFGFDTGILESWSISFNSVYEINYSWSSNPTGSLSCTECEDPTITPTADTEYFLTTQDSYGCEIQSSFNVTLINDPGPILNLICNSTGPGEITFSWDALMDATFYEISFDGINWVNIASATSHILSGLPQGSTIAFWVRGGNTSCVGPSAMTTCMVPNCNAPNVNLTILNPATCFGDDDGDFRLVATGGMGPYSYDNGLEVNNTGVFTNLLAGNYVVTITDAASCIVNFSVNVLQPDTISTTPIINSEISCQGEIDGSASFEVMGGKGPYSFNWTNGETDSLAIALGAGLTYVNIEDSNGCTFLDSIELIEPMTLTATAVVFQEIDCFGDSNGVLIAEAMGGTAPYSFVWQEGTVSDTLKDVGAGNYLVIVTDDRQCQITANVNLLNAPEIISTTNFTPPLCSSSTDAIANVGATGGTGSLNFAWSNGDMGPMATGLSSQKYYVSITDQNQCEHIDSVEIQATNPLVLTGITQDVACNGESTGSIDLMISGANGTTQIEWTATDSGSTFQTEDLDLIPVDLYCVLVTDQNLCTASECFMVGEPDMISVVADITDVACGGGDTGEIDITISGGVGNYTVVWQNESSFNNEDLNMLAAGEYFLTITDGSSCVFMDSYFVGQNNGVTVQENITEVLCFGEATGAIDLEVMGGTMPLQYDWTGPNMFNSILEDISALEAGNYILDITDAMNCTSQFSFEVAQPIEALTASILNDQICEGSSTGQLEVTVSGGTGNYSYEWSTGGQGDVVVGLPTGNYSVIVTDENQCSITATGNVISVNEIDVFVSATDPSCSYLSDGAAIVDSLYANGILVALTDFNFEWSTFPQQTGIFASGLQGNNSYTVTVIGQDGCESQQTVFVNNPAEIDINLVESINPLCNASNTGSIEVIGSGGTGMLEYEWDFSTNFQDSAFANNLFPGQYFVTVSDQNNCSTSTSYTLTDPPVINLNANIENVSCPGYNDGSVSLSPNGGVGTFDILWSNGEVGLALDELIAGTYYVSLTDESGCIIEDSILISQPADNVQVTIDAQDVSCFGGFDGMISVTAEGGNGIYTYSLDGEDFGGSPVLIGLEAGSYDVYVQDFLGCQTVISNVIINQPQELELVLGQNKVVDYGSSLQLFPTVNNGQGAISFQWTSPAIDQFNCDNCQFPTIENITDDISLELVVEDSVGCVKSLNVFIAVVIKDFIEVPTGFTPNGDGNNDLLTVFGMGDVVVNDFKIYDRWGELVYSNEDFLTNDITLGWDGFFRGKKAMPGVYIWTAEVESVDGSITFYDGQTNLID